MIYNQIDNLIKRYTLLYPEEEVSNTHIDDIEKKLNVVLSNDFKKILTVYSGGKLGLHSIFTLYDDGRDYNIVNRTLYYRNCDLNLPVTYIALEETEVSFVVLETQSQANMQTKVIECSIEDIYNLAKGNPLLYNPTIFPSFTDFFEYLIKQEEDERKIITS